MSGRPADDVVSFLSDLGTYGQSTPVEVVQTHAAMVFLTGRDAYKIKRPVTYDYLDFSTLEKRRAMLRRELELNRPGAPELYLELVPVTRTEGGGLALGGGGEVAEWCLHMRRFPKGAELSEIAGRGGMTRAIAEEIGRVVAGYHDRAAIRQADGRALVAEVARELDGALAQMTDVLDSGSIERFRRRAAAATCANARLLSERGRAGHVRRGHGDLHLGNLALMDGRPVPFDALEFDERLGTLDVLYDLAFVLMDLLHRGLPAAANAVLGAYLFEADTPLHLDGLALMPLFLGLRAAIRAMVSVQAARLSPDAAAGKRAEARAYLDHALGYLAPPAPRLVAVGGLSGTGKTTLARRLAPAIGPAPGALHLRSDLDRKALFGVDPETRLAAAAYTPEAGERVYARLLEKADRVLAAGHAVVLDAVHLREPERREVADLARRHAVPFAGLWLQAEESTLVARVTARRGDASDADAAVVHKQLAAAGGAPEWTGIAAGGTAEATLERARTALQEAAPAGPSRP